MRIDLAPRLILAVVEHQFPIGSMALVQVLDYLIRGRCKCLINVQELKIKMTHKIGFTGTSFVTCNLLAGIEFQKLVDERLYPADCLVGIYGPGSLFDDGHIASGVQKDTNW